VRRGGYLPPEVRGGVVGDYGRYRLRPPPRGYTWMRVGNAFLLMNMATGQIFDVIED
jgi:Ni/Co efflux regulator RcnB